MRISLDVWRKHHMNAAELFLDRTRSLMLGQRVSGRTLGGARLSVHVATNVNVQAGWGVGFYPSWRLEQAGAPVAASEALKSGRGPTPSTWREAASSTLLLYDRVLEDLIWDRQSGLLSAIFDTDLVLRAPHGAA